jgi:hypothetical protein
MPRICSPNRRMLPLEGTSPVIALQSVVLPMPLRPTMPSTPRSSAKLTPCSTWAWP